MGNKPMSYAQAAQGDWNIVVPKKGKAAVQNKLHKPEKLVQALYPKAEREIVIHFDKNTGSILTDELARDALNMVNRALVDNTGVLSPAFLCSRFSRNNLVFTTGFNHKNMDYDAYLPIICNALASIGPATAVINEQWGKFLVHRVPTYTTMTEIREIVEMQYENLALGQTPRWLLPKDKVEKKESSIVVLALIGKVSMSNIGIKEFVFGNTTCRITEYYPYDEAM
jgi:hypothetical protein